MKRNKELIAVNIQDLNATNYQMQLQQQQLQQQECDKNSNNLPAVRSITGITSTMKITYNGVNGNNTAANTNTTGNNNTKVKVQQGFIAVLKDNFGFIETLLHDQEVFFHFSNFIGNTNHLELGHEVEYTLSTRNGINAGNCIPAENVKVLPKGK